MEGKEAAPVRWECNCLQGKCGACAMLINDFPALACKENLIDYGDTVELMPLPKFPVVEDLEVDRTIIFDHLTEMKVWMEQKHAVKPENRRKLFWLHSVFSAAVVWRSVPATPMAKSFSEWPI